MHFQFRNKGILTLPIAMFSFVAVGVSYALVNTIFKLDSIQHIEGILTGLSMLLAGTINFFASKNYFINSEGDREFYEEEGEFMFIKVSLWTRLFFAIGIISILGAIAEMNNL